MIESTKTWPVYEDTKKETERKESDFPWWLSQWIKPYCEPRFGIPLTGIKDCNLDEIWLFSLIKQSYMIHVHVKEPVEFESEIRIVLFDKLLQAKNLHFSK